MPIRQVEGTNIIISNLKEASDRELLKKYNIKVVMNVCDKETPHHPGIAQFRVKLSDPRDTLAKNNPLWEAVTVFSIAKELADKRKGNILIHCVSGHNRSALVPAIWLLVHNTPGDWGESARQASKEELRAAVQKTQVKDNKPWMKDFGLVWE